MVRTIDGSQVFRICFNMNNWRAEFRNSVSIYATKSNPKPIEMMIANGARHVQSSAIRRPSSLSLAQRIVSQRQSADRAAARPMRASPCSLPEEGQAALCG